METAEYPWNNQNNLVSSLNLLEEEVLLKHDSQWHRDKHLLVEGEPAVTVPREVSRRSPRKPHIVPKTVNQCRASSIRGGGRSTNNAEEEEESNRQLKLENARLQLEITQWQREVEHGHDEKLELEASFRRLDQEIGNGYHLAERKEKELRIAELVMKNQKMSQLLAKELQSHEGLRREHAELQGEHHKLTEQVTLLNQVLDSVETKHTELCSSQKTLTASYEAAQTTIEKLQTQLHVVQDKLATSDTHTQVVTEYESKIQQWTRTCRELEQKCEHKTQKLKQSRQIAAAAQQEAQRALNRQEELEQELYNAHDQIIQANAAMRTMGAKLEANLKGNQHGGQESLHRRIRHLEGELLQTNRTNTELMQTCNELLSSQKRPGAAKTLLPTRSGHVMASRVAKLTTRITTLADKLRTTEEARDRKGRSLDVLMHAFPFLLRRLDATQDQLVAAVESNDILKSALEQMQDPPNAGLDWFNTTNINNEVYGDSSMYLRLARANYLLAAPYPLELLADQTGAQVLRGDHESTWKKTKKFSPFRVTCSVLKGNESEDQRVQLVTLCADSNDVSGASYLNRSKINAFLDVIQSGAARNKFKTLVIGKLAECLTKLRELAHQAASEAAGQQASIQLLQREVADLQTQLKAHRGDNNKDNSDKLTKESYKARRFLLQLVDVYAEKQEDEHRQLTFLTQPLSSDMLIPRPHPSRNEKNGTSDHLCLAASGLEDDDVGQLLMKIKVSSVRFQDITLDSNNLSDLGAQHVAEFVTNPPTSVRVVSLVGNKRITRRGIELIRGGLLRNQRVQQVKEDEHELKDATILRGLAIQSEFDVSGNATEMIRVTLPLVSEMEAELKTVTSEAVDAMTEKLHLLGFRYNLRPSSASSRLRSTTNNSIKRKEGQQSEIYPQNSSRRASVPGRTGASFTRRAPVPNSDGVTGRRRSLPSDTVNRRQQIKQQQDARFQSVEAAIRRASVPRLRPQVSRPQTSTSSQNYRPSCGRSVSGNTIGSSSKRIAAGKTHINTIRGLRR